MTFVEAVRTCFTKYADFRGRASRPEYWWWFLFTVVTSGLLSAIFPALVGVFSLATLVPSLAVGVRRLHDTDRSGWLLLLWFVPILGWAALIIWATQGPREPNRY
jgi:uncharacterized membrane protein YhaH (DUF805 family)